MKRPATLKDIERFMLITGWGVTRFGRESCGDTKLVQHLRNGGRMDRGRDVAIADFMQRYVDAQAEQVRELRRFVK